MKQFLLRLLLFCVGVIALAFIGDYVVSRGLRETRHNEFAEWNDIFDGAIQANVLVSGSSRAWVHVDPKILDSLLKCHSYNLGIDGSDFLMQYARMKAFYAFNKTPSTILQILDITSLEKRDDIFQYGQVLPYYYDSTLHNVVRQYKTYTRADYIIPFLRYRHERNVIVLGLLEFLHMYHKSNNGRDRGYAGMDRAWGGTFDKFVDLYPNGYHVKIDSSLVSAFEDFLRESASKKVRIILIYAPEYSGVHKHFINRDSAIAVYRDFSVKYNVPFIDYSDSAISADKNNFYNSQHLNKTGAEKFSRMLGRDVKEFCRN